MSNPINRLHRDLVHLRHAKHEQANDRHDLRKDKHALKHDHRVLERHVKAGKKQHNKLDHDRKGLDKARKVLGRDQQAEQQKLAKLEAQKAILQQQYNDSFDPANPAAGGDPALLAQIDDVNNQEAAVHTKFDGKIASEQGAVDKQKKVVDRHVAKIHELRAQIKTDRKTVKHDRHDVKHDRRELKHDRKRVHNARHHALSHLRKAEYKMGLKRTNRVRKELGLKPVKHVIRPGVQNVVGGKVGSWIAQAQTILKQHGIPLSKMNARDINIIIQHESGGNPNATNGWDSNAAAGTPSIGLMQTIGPTFNAYKLSGHGNIRNPVDNIIAAVRYAISRYGSISNVPGVRAVHSGGAYVGY